MTYLALVLQERRDAETLADLRTRSRLAYVQGAEDESRRSTGRGLTGEELKQVIERFPGI
ncbi:MAG: hypothetical protein MUQ32_06610 [Chloroflexi bacterium]|nr:hypothetical protein [Chloroflexota bacterium]